jgi:hypothetical protein
MSRRTVVTIGRKNNGWRAEVPTLNRCLDARALYSLFTQLRLLVDVTTAVIQVRTGDADLDGLIRSLGAAQRRADAAAGQVRTLTGRLLARTRDWPSRDVAVLIGKSHQRVVQLRREGDGRD